MRTFWSLAFFIFTRNHKIQFCFVAYKYVILFCFAKKKALRRDTPSILEIIWVKNVRAIVVPIQPISTQIGLDWLCNLAGNSQMAPTIFFKFSGYVFLIISLRTHKPQLPSHF